MPAREVRDRVCAKVMDLQSIAPEVAEDVALAMVTGAAAGFREITAAEPQEATRRILAALNLDPEALLAALVH